MQCYEQTRYSYIKHVNVIQQSRIGFKDAIMLFWYQRSILCNINYGGFVVLVHGLISVYSLKRDSVLAPQTDSLLHML